MIHYIVLHSLNTELLSLRTNKSVFQRVLFAENGILLIRLEALRSTPLTSLSTNSCTKLKSSSLPHFLLLRFFIVEFVLKQQLKLPNLSLLRYGELLLNGEPYDIGNIFTTLFYHFYNNYYLWWSLSVLFNKVNSVFGS